MPREIRKGKRFISVHGEIFQHHDVWVTPFEEWVINRIAESSDMDENHIIGKIVEDWVGKNSDINDRIKFYKNVTLPRVLAKQNIENKEKQEEKKDAQSGS